MCLYRLSVSYASFAISFFDFSSDTIDLQVVVSDDGCCFAEVVVEFSGDFYLFGGSFAVWGQ